MRIRTTDKLTARKLIAALRTLPPDQTDQEVVVVDHDTDVSSTVDGVGVCGGTVELHINVPADQDGHVTIYPTAMTEGDDGTVLWEIAYPQERKDADR